MLKRRWFRILGISLLTFLGVLVAAFLYSRSWKNSFFLDPLYEIHIAEVDSGGFKPHRKVVALTFDDGPSSTRTPALLDLLNSYNVKATFFMLGEMIEKYPGIARRVLDDGHLIGNHSYNHPRLILKSPGFIRDQIEKTDSLIHWLGQEKVEYFRPPYSSKFILLPWILSSMNKQLVTGTYDPPSEYASPYNGEKVADEIIANITPGAIIYLHDGKSSDVEEFLRSVELTIIELRNQGYEFVRVDGRRR